LEDHELGVGQVEQLTSWEPGYSGQPRGGQDISDKGLVPAHHERIAR